MLRFLTANTADVSAGAKWTRPNPAHCSAGHCPQQSRKDILARVTSQIQHSATYWYCIMAVDTFLGALRGPVPAEALSAGSAANLVLWWRLLTAPPTHTHTHRPLPTLPRKHMEFPANRRLHRKCGSWLQHWLQSRFRRFPWGPTKVFLWPPYPPLLRRAWQLRCVPVWGV